MRTEQVFITCDECLAIDATELRFAINGRNFAIDLCTVHRAVFDTLIQPYVTNGHPVRFNNHVVRKDGKQRASAEKPVLETADPKKVRKSRAKVKPEMSIDQANQIVSEGLDKLANG